jgi:hypothetical protein
MPPRTRFEDVDVTPSQEKIVRLYRKSILGGLKSMIESGEITKETTVEEVMIILEKVNNEKTS